MGARLVLWHLISEDSGVVFVTMARRASGVESVRERTAVKKTDVLAMELKDDGVILNSKLPLLVYRRAVSIAENDPAHVFEELFAENGWGDSWRNGIYPYQHYHSTAHEVLGIYQGSAKVQLGGEHGVIHEVRAGDVIVIPAGVAHKNLGSSDDFGVVGAYPEGQEMDMNYGKASERVRAIENIAHLALPKMDPVFGENGPLIEKWRG
jgi:uncharacterized protein YjlB